jgi:hypothetical protein
MRTLATVFVACLLIVTPVVKGENSGLMASPSQLNFSVPFGSSSTTQNVNITFNGAPVTVLTVSTLTVSTPPTAGQNWLLVSIISPGFLTTTVNPAGPSGSYSGTVTAVTAVGTISFPVNLNVGAAPPATPAPPSWILILTGLAAAGLYQMRRMRPVASPGR